MTVHLVGAGPGDPDLLTVKAASLLARADVVMHDRLVDPRVLALAAPWAELIDVGKTPGSRRNSQDEINQTLIDRGRRFGCVVRLKGGDPFVFGRGGEEAVELLIAGVDVEEVPGVSSAIAAPAAAGIPVTMRGISAGLTVITAHEDPEHDLSLDWDALANTGTTLVILMGAARAASIADRLILGGMANNTPVAVITAATTPQQFVIRTVLDQLGTFRIVNPSTIVVGQVAAYDVLDPAAYQHAAVRSSHPTTHTTTLAATPVTTGFSL
jgi:uroporphyrin-III C-methyltransferase